MRVLRRTALALVSLVLFACGGTSNDPRPRPHVGNLDGASGMNEAQSDGGASDASSDTGADARLDPAGDGALDGGEPPPDDDLSDASAPAVEAGRPSGADAGGAPAGDALPYANVVLVDATGSSGSYSFSVSVESADVDCSQYANWWEVLSEDGALLYRRILEHSHTDENGTSDEDAPGNTFTRSGGPVPVAQDEVVIVRAHMSVGGYRGRAQRGSVAEGFADAPDLDDTFLADVEDQDPQPTTCLF